MTTDQPTPNPNLSGRSTALDDLDTESGLRRRVSALHWQAVGAAAEADHRAQALEHRAQTLGNTDRGYQDQVAQVEALREQAADLAAQEQQARQDLAAWQDAHDASAQATDPTTSTDNAATSTDDAADAAGEFVIAWDPPTDTRDHAAAQDAAEQDAADAWDW